MSGYWLAVLVGAIVAAAMCLAARRFSQRRNALGKVLAAALGATAVAFLVASALFLVVGCRRVPRPGSVPRVFVITAAYTAFVGVVDAITGANYMFLRHDPGHSSLLSVLGPWPWYIVSAAVVAIVLFAILDAPFRAGRVRSRTCSPVPAP